MTQEQQAMILNLQQVGLTMDDLRIYLDTHLEDAFAMDRFNQAAEAYQGMLGSYNARFGPLTGTCPQQNNSEGWLWGETDFPWQD